MEGYSLNFANYHTDTDNQRFMNWYQLLLFEDFMSCLEECGRLPVPTIQGYRQEIVKVNELMSFIENKNLKDEFEKFMPELAGVVKQQRSKELEQDVEKLDKTNVMRDAKAESYEMTIKKKE